MNQTPFRLRKVCNNCPFRADVPFLGLSSDRVTEIADALRGGATFHCHKTLADSGDDLAVNPASQFCAGALATMEQGGEVNQSVRIAERLGMYDPAEFDWAAQPVFSSLEEWEAALVERATDD